MSNSLPTILSVFLIANIIGAAGSLADEGQDVTIKEFVRQHYVRGIPYKHAVQFPPEVVPILGEMLQDRDDEPFWSNIAVTIGFIGHERAAKILIEHFERGNGLLTADNYRSKTSALISLGFVVNRSSNQTALGYLVDTLSDESLKKRGLEWQSPFFADRDQQIRDIRECALLGLGVSGSEGGLNTLTAVAKDQRFIAAGVQATIQEAVKANKRIQKVGLKGYYD